MNKKKIVAIVGSFRRDSFNRQLAQKAQRIWAIAPSLNYRVCGRSEYESGHRVPTRLPSAGSRADQAADGIWIFSPAYNTRTGTSEKPDRLALPAFQQEERQCFRESHRHQRRVQRLGGTVTGQDLLSCLTGHAQCGREELSALGAERAGSADLENGVLHLKDTAVS
jgi:chromate reductase